MTFWTLIRRSLRFHARSHLGVVLGATIGSTTLIGALIVGDSVKGSLTARALSRLGATHFAMTTGDRFFSADLAYRLGEEKTSGHTASIDSPSTALMLPGTAARADGDARANRVTILGVDVATWPHFSRWQTGGMSYARNLRATANPPLPDLSKVLEKWREGEIVLLNETLAQQLNAHDGDEIILRVQKPSALALDAVITPRDQTSIALRARVGPVLTTAMMGDFELSVGQTTSANAFLPLDILANKVELAGRANLVIQGPVLSKRPLGWWQQSRLKLQLWAKSWWPHSPRPPTALSGVASPTDAVAALDGRIKRSFRLEDAQLAIRTNSPAQSASGDEYLQPSIEITTSRVFLEPQIVAAALTSRSNRFNDHPESKMDSTDELASSNLTNNICLLTYLSNLIQSGDKATPYSMITAADAPFVPRDMRADEIVVNEWLAEDLHVRPGDKLDLVYYAVDSASHLTQRTNSFHVRGVVPLKGIYADSTLMPDFPGIAKAETTHEWDAGFPLIYTIRDKDEAYWKQHRGTPKAFVTLSAGQSMWASRFGSLTSIRYPVPNNSSLSTYGDSVYRQLLANLDPGNLGFRFQPVRAQALKAANQAQDFGQLFLGFSFFLVVAALLLMALLFQFSLEQRATEVGTFLAFGFTPSQVRRLLLSEGAALAFIGGLVGTVGGIAYAKAMLWGLATIWHDAVAGSQLDFYASLLSLLIGLCASTVVAMLAIWLTLRRQARQPARELLAGETGIPKPGSPNRTWWLAFGAGIPALGIIGWLAIKRDTANAEGFFCAGTLLLVAGLALAGVWLGKLDRLSSHLTLAGLGVRACARRRKRSIATMALLACGCFVIAAIGVFRLDANQDSTRRSSGTGGFAFVGQSTLSIAQDLNTETGREFFGLSSNVLANVKVISLRVHDGDEASCLNLNRAQKPRLLGVNPHTLDGRFTFAAIAKGLDKSRGWSLLTHEGRSHPESGPSALEDSTSTAEIPAIGDANSIEWALGKKIGDTLDYTDGYGRPFRLRLVAGVANSILQGSLLIDEAEFVKRFPGESGCRMFLVDEPSDSGTNVVGILSRALQDVGFELTPAVQRLNAFNAVQNTYLGTFQILGGLGLLVGSAGLGVVVLRNVLERRGELGLLLAVGFRRRQLHWLILSEHGALLGLGLCLGLIAAAVAVLPSLLSPATQLPFASLALTLAAICLNGALWTWLATRSALRGNLLEALRKE